MEKNVNKEFTTKNQLPTPKNYEESESMRNRRLELQHLMETRPGPFQLVCDNILPPRDPLFVSCIANDPHMMMFNAKQRMNRRIHAKIKIHQYQDDGTYKLNEDIEPYTFAELFEQQRLILLYEYKKERYKAQNKEQTRMNVCQIIDKFSNMVSQNLEHLTIQELKNELIRFRLKVAGNKRNLVTRMVEKYEQLTNAELSHISMMSLSSIDNYLNRNNSISNYQTDQCNMGSSSSSSCSSLTSLSSTSTATVSSSFLSASSPSMSPSDDLSTIHYNCNKVNKSDNNLVGHQSQQLSSIYSPYGQIRTDPNYSNFIAHLENYDGYNKIENRYDDNLNLSNKLNRSSNMIGNSNEELLTNQMIKGEYKEQKINTKSSLFPFQISRPSSSIENASIIDDPTSSYSKSSTSNKYKMLSPRRLEIFQQNEDNNRFDIEFHRSKLRRITESNGATPPTGSSQFHHHKNNISQDYNGSKECNDHLTKIYEGHNSNQDLQVDNNHNNTDDNKNNDINNKNDDYYDNNKNQDDELLDLLVPPPQNSNFVGLSNEYSSECPSSLRRMDLIDQQTIETHDSDNYEIDQIKTSSISMDYNKNNNNDNYNKDRNNDKINDNNDVDFINFGGIPLEKLGQNLRSGPIWTKTKDQLDPNSRVGRLVLKFESNNVN